MNDERTLTEVAVGLVFDRDGRVLLGQRPAGKPYAGWWEFPGGKLEPGESVAEALARELHEELGIEVRSSQPWIVREHSYPHARVRLHFRRVFDWTGEPVAREGQDFGWTRPDAIDREPLLPATVPILAMLALPPRMVGLAVDRLASGRRPRPSEAGTATDAAGGIRPRVAFVLDAAGGHGPVSGASDPGRLEHALDRLRAIAGAVVCAAGPWPANLADRCDGIVAVAAELPARDAAPGLRGLRIDRLEQLETLGKVDADFAVVTVDVSARTREFARAMAGTQMPVYLLVGRDLNPGARPPGLQGTASGFWRGAGPVPA